MAAPRKRHARRSIATHRAAYGSFQVLEDRCLLAAAVLELDSEAGVAVDADGFVSRWVDQSGAENDLIAAGDERPDANAVTTPSGRSALSLDGVDDRLLRTLSEPGGISGLPDGNAARTVFLVAQFHDADAWGGFSYGAGGVNQAFGVGAVSSGAEAGELFLQGWGGGQDLFSGVDAFSSPGATSGWLVLSAVHSGDEAANTELFVNGISAASWSHAYNTNLASSAILNGNTFSRIVIGEEIREFGHVQMDVAAVRIYDDALSPSERGAIETSLTTRFITGGDAPVATADSAVVQLADLVQIDVLGNDTDNDSDLDPTSVNILTDPVSGTVTVDPVTGGVTYRHDGSANSASFTYTVSDLAGNVSNTATVDVTLASWSLDDFSDAEVTSGLNQPISIGFLPDERLLVLEKRGQIHIVDPNTGSRQLYMELTNINTQGERGLLDITLAPDFDPTAPGADYFYVYYTPAAPQLARIARFEHIENGGGLTSEGDVSSEFLVWEDTDGYVSCCHFGGGLDFGPDGKLWLTTSDKFTAPNPGETASFLPGGIGQPKNNIARDLTTGGGKIIRVNPDGSVPDGTDGWAANPYVDPVDDDPEVAGNQDYHDYAWGFGLRNPWRARWDLESERFFLAEVGGNQQAISYEDVHIATLDNPGADFGWNMCEGPGVSVYLPDGPCGEHELPIFSYGHNGVGASLTGGEVYRGDQFPAEWNGVYFYGDFTRDFIRFLTFDSTGEVSGDYPFKPTGEIPGVANQVVFIGVGADGSLYYVLLGGEVRRVTHDSTNSAPEILLATADPTSGDSPLTVNFTAQVTDAESDEITYTWHFGDGTTAAGTVTNGAANVSHTYNADGSFEAFLQVDDGQSVFSDVMAIEVGAPNVAPVIATFEADPASGDLPLEVTFTASVSDADGDTLTWEINFGNGTTSGVQTVPQSGQISASFAYGTNGAFNAFLTVWDASEGTTSNPVTISAGQQSSIPITNGLVFLIESDIKVAVSSGTTVASWLDESGWGNNLDAFGDPQFVANATPGGQAAVVFDGDGDRLERLAAHTINQFPTGADDRTMFAVVNYVDSQGVWAGVSYGDSAVNETFGLVTDGVAGELTVQGYGTDLQSSTAGQGEGWAIQSVTVSAGEVTQFKDGTVIDSRAHTFATDLTGTSARLVIGEEIGGLGNSQMELAAVVLFDRALTAAERQQVEDYLHSKYFVGNAPPQAADDTVRAAANGTVAIDVLANDSDSDGVLNPATVQIIGQPTHGTVSVNPANGAITYTNDGEGTNDSFSYLVNDEVGASSNVATVDVAIGAGTLVGAGLVVHLESDAGVAVDSTTVQGWLDSSGNGNDLQTVVGTPQLVGDATPGGHSAIRFDGSQSLSRTETLNALPTGDEDRTVFLVAKYDATSVWAGASFGTGAPNQSFGLAVDGTGGDLTLAGWGAGNDFVSNAAGTGTGWLVQSVVLNDNRFEHYSTGSLVDSGFHQFDTGSTQLALAAEISGLGFVDMDMAAVLVYNRALSETERHEVEAYLFDKYFNAAINTPPEFTSPLSASIDENSVAVMTLTATDPDSDMLTYTVSGGADGSYFQITGDGPASHDHLEFINPPDFEVPLDADTDNEYEVEVSVFDGTDTTTSLVTVAVNDVEEPFFGDNLVLHLETDHGVVLDGSGVFEWQDQSDSGNDLFAAAGERPATNVTTTPNGSTAVSFDGQNDRLLRTTTDGLTALPDENAARTMVMVVRFHDAAAWGGAGWGAGAVNQAFGAGVGQFGWERGPPVSAGLGRRLDFRFIRIHRSCGRRRMDGTVSGARGRWHRHCREWLPIPGWHAGRSMESSVRDQPERYGQPQREGPLSIRAWRRDR